MSQVWDQRYLQLARMVALWSKDPSTQCGAVLVRPDKTLASLGFNGFPRGMADDVDKYADRAVKYPHIIHSEWNAIRSCMDPSLRGYTVYAWPMPPCNECTAPLVQKGIARVVCPEPSQEKLSRWQDAFSDALDMWKQSGADVCYQHIVSDEDDRFGQLYEGADKWDSRFVNMAHLVATWSKDPIAPRGALLVRSDKTVASLGFNGYPQSIDDTGLIHNHPNARSARLLPAELNAVLFSQDPSLKGAHLYTSHPPTLRTVAHLIHEGVFHITCADGVLENGIQQALSDVGGQINLLRPYT